ncbi:MAG: CRISPR-associated protein Csc3 [Richelia sp. RM1_1_1]|nr:CRISPR-associated protein Csc3 [Richelia sp. RM1_1_1]
MPRHTSLLNRPPKTLEEIYFSEIRPQLYENHAHQHQYGVRTGTTLAEHLDSACQFVLTVSYIAGVVEHKRGLILAATAVHDLNKLDPEERKVKTLARDKIFLREQLEKACVLSFINSEDDLELVRKLIERHSGHNVTDGARFLPEDENIKKWAAMVTAADLFDLGIPDVLRFRKLETELTVAFNRPCKLFRVRLSEDRGYITALLLGACEEVLKKYGLNPLAIFPDGELFAGDSFPSENLIEEIAGVWQSKIDQVFGNNIEQLVRATKDGIKVAPQAIQQNLDEVLINVQALLEKKKAGFKADKISKDIAKWGETAGSDAIIKANELGLIPVSNAEEFAISEGLKAAYLSYRETGLNPRDVWNKIAIHTGISEQQRVILEEFNGQYGRPLFAVKGVIKGIDGIQEALRESLELRRENTNKTETSEASEEIIAAVSQMLNLPIATKFNGGKYLEAYVEANPKQRCSLGSSSSSIDDLISDNMPPGTKVQAFSNRLPGGISAEPKRQADSVAALAYQLMAVGANFPAVKKQDPLYLHFSLPKGSAPELLRIWRDFLQRTAETNPDGGTVTVDEFQLYRDNAINFKANKVVGFAFPKRPNFIHNSVIIPLVWGDTNTSVALLKSLWLALELSLSLEFGFPFTLGGTLEVELSNDIYGRVEGIPGALQSLLESGQYNRQEAEKIRDRFRCIGKLAISIASIQKADDCLYDLARACTRPIELYYVLLRWILREQDEPNLSMIWSRIKEPLHCLLESLMPNDNSLLTQYLKEAAKIAAEANLKGSSFKRTSITEPFTAFTSAVRSHKSYMDLDFMFAVLSQEYHTRLDRIRENGVGLTKLEQIKSFYSVLRKLYEDIYQARPEKLLSDRDKLEAAYLFFYQEADQQFRKKKKEDENAEVNTLV